MTPDLTTLGKGIAGGTPISVVSGKSEILDLCGERIVVGAGTFNGYPLGVAAALATINYVEQDDGAFFRRVAAVQARLMAEMREIAGRRGPRMLIQNCPGVMMFTRPMSIAPGTSASGTRSPTTPRASASASCCSTGGCSRCFVAAGFFSGALTDDDVRPDPRDSRRRDGRSIAPPPGQTTPGRK